MKLWTKSFLGVLSATAVFGAALGGLYAYSLSDKSKGDKQYSARGLKNNINDFKKVDAYNINFVSSINPNIILGKYDYKTDTVNGKPAQAWVKDIIADGKQIPILNVNAGPVRFENFYPEAIFPKDFVKFVEWFSNDVSWGADISSLSYFRIKRGIEYGESGGTVTLGSYSADKQSTKRIQFIPDSFYGEADISLAILQMFPHPVSRKIIETLVEVINKQNKSLAGSPEKMLKIYSIEKKGDDLYLPIISSADDLIFKWEKGNPTMLKEVSNDIDVETDLKTGQSKLVNKPGKHLPSDGKIPKLAIYRTMAGNKWKGLNFHWLKYVTQHEYGHMQTMGMVSDGATSPIQLGPSRNNSPNAASASATFDLDEINRYLQARLPQLKAIRASVNLTSNGGNSNWDFYDDHLNDPIVPNPKHFNNIAWEIKGSSAADWTRETIEDIFGSSADVTDPNKAPYRIDPKEFIQNIKNGKNPRFFTKSLKDQRALAQQLGIPVAGTYLMNAFDNMIATTSSGFNSGLPSDPSNVKSLQFLDSNESNISERKWVSPVQAIKNMKSYDGGQLFKEVDSATFPKYTSKEIKKILYDVVDKELDITFTYTKGTENPSSDILTKGPQFIKDYFNKNSPNTANQPTIREFMKAIDSATSITVDDLNTFLGAANFNKDYFIKNQIVKDNIGTDDGTTVLKTAKDNLKNYFSEFFVKIPPKGFTNQYLSIYVKTKKLNGFLTAKELKAFFDTLNKGKLTNPQISNLLKDIGAKTSVPSTDDFNLKTDLFLIKVNDEGKDHYFDVSETATDKEGNNISQDPTKKDELKIWFNSVIEGLWKKSTNGREDKRFNQIGDLSKIKYIENKTELEKEIGKPDSTLNQWLSNPNLGSPSALKSLFADYTYLFSEVLTRDWVQMTYQQESSDKLKGQDAWFRYQSNIAPVQEINTGIERYLDPSIFLSKETKAFFDTKVNANQHTPVQQRRLAWLKGLIDKGNDKAKSDADFSKKWKILLDSSTDFELESYSQMKQLYYGIREIIVPKKYRYPWLIYTNCFYNGGKDSRGRDWTHASLKNLLTKPSFTNNGYNVDRWLRAALAPKRAEEGTGTSWALYNNDGSPAQDKEITIKDFATGENEGDWKVAENRVRAYWSFFMQSRGVGLRTISKIWRVPDRDAFSLWGYVRNEWEKNLKNLTFTNSSTGEKKSFPVIMGGNNLFYYEHQGGGKRRTLHDDGYTSWTVDFLSLGTWFDSNVQNGDWIMSFTNKNGKELKQTTTPVNGKAIGTGHVAKDDDVTAISLFDLGKKERITENGFDEGYAPVIIEKNDKRVVMHIKNQFPI